MPYDAIVAWMAQWDVHFMEPTVFGTTDPYQIACLIDAFCQKELDAAVVDYLFYESSQGAVCGVCLADGRRVVLKIRLRSIDFLKAVIQVQHYLRNNNYPCTKPLLDPRPLANGIATVEEFVDEGVYCQAHDPAIRRSMAEMLAWLIRLTRTPASIPGFQPADLDGRLPVPAGVIWPTPHSKLFDFEATTAGAEWIDEIARKAREIKVHGAGQLVVGHMDWSVKHLRYIGERVNIIYDWDSLVLEKEPVIVGHASINFTYTEFFDGPKLPTQEESAMFIAEYEAARGKPFTSDEHQVLEAADIYGLAYGARCEHALMPHETSYPAGSCRSLLAQRVGREKK